MVTLELPQARRLAASVVLGQVVITVVAAAICFAVWGRTAGLSALAGGGISAAASAVLALIGFASPAGAEAERVARAFYVGEAAKLAVDLGVDVNATNKDGRTALDAAQRLKYDSLVTFLREKGAKPGSGAAAPPDRGKDSGRSAISR